MKVRATYRLQFHAGFTFADALAILDYLDRLGISHVYASPISTAQPGSKHGYDVIDHTRVNPELGGEEGLRSLVAALRERNMGLIVDIVPNHMGIAGSGNRWWQDVLAQGQASPYASFFDIDWRRKLLLPLLGEPLDQALEHGAIRIAAGEDGPMVVVHDSHLLPLRAVDRALVANTIAHFDPGANAGRQAIAALLQRQHYQLAWWRTANDELNWRRFFTITELAGLRVEDDAVFEAVHALYFRLYAEGLIDGVRVDHVDGLTDPAAYCRKLRDRLEGLRHQRPAGSGDEPPYIVVEKILGAGERLSSDWGVDGTTGYDFMDEASAVLHEPAGEAALDASWTALSGRPAAFEAEELEARRQMLAWEFEGQLSGCVEAFAELAASGAQTRHYTRAMLRRALQCLLWVFPVYRTYATAETAPPSDAQVRRRARERALALAAPGEGEVIDAVLEWLAGQGPGQAPKRGEAVRRFQQLSAPIAAKAVEDTAFYRYGRLLSRNDVGFDLARFSLSGDEFHARMKQRAERFPRAMLATATHDHKRGEDVRGRLAVLSEIPHEWIERAGRWRELLGQAAQGIAPDDLYRLLQMMLGAFPGDNADLADFAGRIGLWQEKALREAKLHSSWTQPNADYEKQARALIDHMLDARGQVFIADLKDFLSRILPGAHANGLAVSALRCLVPGVPDLYQGTEFEDLSLVDPDNRRPVDFSARNAALGTPADGNYSQRKQALIARLLSLRGKFPDLFGLAGYDAVGVMGPKADRVLAFKRSYQTRTLLAAVIVRCGSAMTPGRLSPPADWWKDTRLDWSASGNGETIIGGSDSDLSAANLFANGPVHVSLYRGDLT